MAKYSDQDISKAREVFASGATLKAVSAALKIPLATLENWSSKYKWSVYREKAVERATKKFLKHPGQNLTERSSRARLSIASIVEAQIEELAAQSHRNLGNSPAGEGQASVAGRVIENASKVYGWTPENAGGRDYAPGDLSRLEAIEIESSCVQDTLNGCGADKPVIGGQAVNGG